MRTPRELRQSKPGLDLMYARSCYDHIAGELGVALHDVFLDRGWAVVNDRIPVLTDAGEAFLGETFELDIAALRRLRRPLVRLDLDWTERRDHLAGSVPAALMTEMLERSWLRRRTDKRVLQVTEIGRKNLATHFGLKM